MKKGCVILVAAVVVLVIAIVLLSAPSEKRPETAQPTQTTAEKVMYFCGIDRCRGSLEYGNMVFETGINVWEGRDPDRGKVLREANHHDRAVIIDEVMLGDYVGEHWYKLKGGGWTNGLWLTEEPCTEENLEEYSEDC